MKKKNVSFGKALGITSAVIFGLLLIGAFFDMMSSDNSRNLQDSSIANKPNIIISNKTYNELWSIFKPNSRYTDLQKEKIFDREYKGKYVLWSGRIKNIDTTMFDHKIVVFVEERNKKMYDIDGGDIVLYLDKKDYDKVIDFNKGDNITYQGKFIMFHDFIGTTFYLDNVKIIR